MQLGDQEMFIKDMLWEIPCTKNNRHLLTQIQEYSYE